MLSTITLVFWIVSGLLAVSVCLYNAHKTRGGRLSGGFTGLAIGAAFLDAAAITITFAPRSWDPVYVQFAHDIGFVIGFICILMAANRFRKAMMGI